MSESKPVVLRRSDLQSRLETAYHGRLIKGKDGESDRREGGVVGFLNSIPKKSVNLREQVERDVNELYHKIQAVIMKYTEDGPVRTREKQMEFCAELDGNVDAVGKTASKQGSILFEATRTPNGNTGQRNSKFTRVVEQLMWEARRTLPKLPSEAAAGDRPKPKSGNEKLAHDSGIEDDTELLAFCIELELSHIFGAEMRRIRNMTNDIGQPLIDAKEHVTDGNMHALLTYAKALRKSGDSVVQSIKQGESWERTKGKYPARRKEALRLVNMDAALNGNAHTEHAADTEIEEHVVKCDRVERRLADMNLKDLEQPNEDRFSDDEDVRRILVPNTVQFLEDRQEDSEMTWNLTDEEREFLTERYWDLRRRTKHKDRSRLRKNMRMVMTKEANGRFHGGLEVLTDREICVLCDELAAEVPDEKKLVSETIDGAKTRLKETMLRRVLQGANRMISADVAFSSHPDGDENVIIVSKEQFDFPAVHKGIEQAIDEAFDEQRMPETIAEARTLLVTDPKKLLKCVTGRTRGILKRLGYWNDNEFFVGVDDPSADTFDLAFVEDNLSSAPGDDIVRPELDEEAIVSQTLLRHRDKELNDFPLLSAELELLEDYCRMRSRDELGERGATTDAVLQSLMDDESLAAWAEGINDEFHAGYPCRSDDDLILSAHDIIERILGESDESQRQPTDDGDMQHPAATEHDDEADEGRADDVDVPTTVADESVDEHVTDGNESINVDVASYLHERIEGIDELLSDIDDMVSWVESWPESNKGDRIRIFRHLAGSMASRMKEFAEFHRSGGSKAMHTRDAIESDVAMLKVLHDRGIVTARGTSLTTKLPENGGMMSLFNELLDNAPNVRLGPGALTPTLKSVLDIVRIASETIVATSEIIKDAPRVEHGKERIRARTIEASERLTNVEREIERIRSLLTQSGDRLESIDDWAQSLLKDIMALDELTDEAQRAVSDASEAVKAAAVDLSNLAAQGEYEQAEFDEKTRAVQRANQRKQDAAARYDELKSRGIGDTEAMRHRIEECHARLGNQPLEDMMSNEGHAPNPNDLTQRIDEFTSFCDDMRQADENLVRLEEEKKLLASELDELDKTVQDIDAEAQRIADAQKEHEAARSVQAEVERAMSELLGRISS